MAARTKRNDIHVRSASTSRKMGGTLWDAFRGNERREEGIFFVQAGSVY